MGVDVQVQIWTNLIFVTEQPRIMSASTTTQATTTSRSRTQSRKKANDDAAYFGPPPSNASVSATKRQAPDKPEGEPRVKRKRVETGHIIAQTNGKKDNTESEPRKSLVSGSFFSTWFLTQREG